jgi:hypothetical protein
MDNKLNYQQAKIVRKQSLRDVIADELIRGKGVGSAISGAIGLKTQANIKGIKEKFDPLNIVKFLTFGSRLGPALYGRLFGRSKKDIEYFAGRAKPIGRKSQKLTKDAGDEGDENTGGMKKVLKQILTFLKKSHEHDMLLREEENNLKESNKLHDEKRHQELLKALGVRKPEEEVPTATPVEKPKEDNGFLNGIMDSIKELIAGIESKIRNLIEDFKSVREILSGLNNIKNLFTGGIFAQLLVFGTLFALEGYLFKKFKDWSVSTTEKRIKEFAAQGDVKRTEREINIRNKQYDDLPVAAENTGGAVDEVMVNTRLKNELKIAADAGSTKAKEALEKLNKEESEKRQEYIKNLKLPAGTQPTAAQLRDAERYVLGQIDLTGGSAPSETEKLITKKVTETLEKWFTPPPEGTPEAERYQKFFEDRQRSLMNNNMPNKGGFKPFDPLFPAPTTVPYIKPEADNPNLKREPTKPVSVGELIQENLDLSGQIAAKRIATTTTPPTTVASAGTPMKKQSESNYPMPYGRNLEESFRRAIV